MSGQLHAPTALPLEKGGWMGLRERREGWRRK